MSRSVRLTLALHRAVQRLRGGQVRRRFDAEEQAVLAEDLTGLRSAHGRRAVWRQWPALVRDGLADVVTTRRVSPRDTFTRRGGDLMVAALFALPAAVVVAVLAVAVRCTSHGPALVAVPYRGRAGQTVRLWKLRTMTDGDRREVTAVGRILRRSRLDELPTLLALARGEVTLVGPGLQRAGSTDVALPVRPGLIRSPIPRCSA